MRKFFRYLFGYCRVIVSGASPQWFLSVLAQKKIPFWDISFSDEFQIAVSVPRSFADNAKQAAESAMCSIKDITPVGAPHFLRGFQKRWYVPIMLIAAIVAASSISRHMLFFEVVGNKDVPSEKILRAVFESGISWGMNGKNIPVSKIENAVLLKVPEISWLTLNQSGMKTQIVVREKNNMMWELDRRKLRNIVAGKAGIINQISVLEGEAVVKPGNSVAKGDILISGCVDLEYKYRLCGAGGEVYARTWYTPELVMPKMCEEKVKNNKEKSLLYLCFGQKRIKIGGDSSIQLDRCEKNTQEKIFFFPGGLSLPIYFIKETFCFYDGKENVVLRDLAQSILSESALAEIRRDMIAGTVRKSQFDLLEERDCYRLAGQVECQEMIGRLAEIEIFKGEKQHDGTSN